MNDMASLINLVKARIRHDIFKPEVLQIMYQWIERQDAEMLILLLDENMGGIWNMRYDYQPDDFGYETVQQFCQHCNVPLTPFTIVLAPQRYDRGTTIIVPDARVSEEKDWVKV